MKDMKQTRKTKYTQTVLKNSLIELMKEKSISRITVKELCENADINRTTFYTHYSDQYHLLKCIEDDTITWIKEIIAGFSGKTNKKDFMTNIEQVLKYFIENKNHIQILMSEQGDIEFQRKLLSVIYEQCGIWLSNDINFDLIKSEMYFVFIINGSLGLIQHWLKTGLRETTTAMAEIIFNMSFNTRI
jgi:Transcriptional regulator